MSKILLIGGDSDHNLGDDAILTAVCDRLARRRPGLQLVITGRRERRRPSPTVTHCIRRGPGGFPDLIRTARCSDRTLIVGGGLFQDDDSRVKMPYWAMRLAVLHLVGARCSGLAIGAGPLSHPESRLAAGWSCKILERFSVRDEFARLDLQNCTKRIVRVVPDPAFMLAPAADATARACLRANGVPIDRPLLGVALRRWFHKLGGVVPHRVRASIASRDADSESRMLDFIRHLATVVRRVARQLEADVLLLPTYTVAHEADHTAGSMLRAELPDVRVHEAIIDEPATYKAVAGRLSLLLSARMHPMIMAAGMGVPIVGLAYNQKFAGLFEILDLPQRIAWMNDVEREPETVLAQLESHIEAAMTDSRDLTSHCDRLAAQTEAELLAIVDGQTTTSGMS